MATKASSLWRHRSLRKMPLGGPAEAELAVFFFIVWFLFFCLDKKKGLIFPLCLSRDHYFIYFIYCPSFLSQETRNAIIIYFIPFLAITENYFIYSFYFLIFFDIEIIGDKTTCPPLIFKGNASFCKGNARFLKETHAFSKETQAF